MKKCFKCGVEKEIDEFYKHPNMADGHLGKCKDCAKSYINQARIENPEKLRLQDRTRYRRHHEKRLAASADYHRKHPDEARAWARRHAERYPEKTAARRAFSNAVRDGKVKRQSYCSACESTIRVHGHHEDYSRPFDVVWLCSKCHGLRHAEINEERRNNLTVSFG
jgi:hypothetical protein